MFTRVASVARCRGITSCDGRGRGGEIRSDGVYDGDTQWHLSDLLSELDSYGKRSMAGLPGRGIGMNARLDCKMSHITFPDRVASRRASPALKRDASVARIMVIPHCVFTLQASARVTRHHAIPE